MIKEFKNENLILVTKFYCKILVLDILQASFSPNGKGHTLSNRFTVLEPSRSITQMELIRRWLMGKELNIILQVLPLTLKPILFKQLHRRNI
jgi:hypothetical protein